MKVLGGVGLILICVAALGTFVLTLEADREAVPTVCFDNVQGFRQCVSTVPRCGSDTDCMEKFGGDGSPEPCSGDLCSKQ